MVERNQNDDATAGLRALSPAFAPAWGDRSPGMQTLAMLYEKGKRQQWNAATDVDWTASGRSFGDALPDDSAFALACFDSSALARYGRPTWDVFRWEFQSWMVSQFLPGEQAAMIASARLVEIAPDADARLCLATQVADEARHIEVFSRYVREKIPAPYPVSPSMAALLRDTLGDARWDMTVLGMQILIETMALAAFRFANRTFHDDLLRGICARVAQDESRHVSIGVLSLRGFYAGLTASELKERQEFMMDAANLVRQRFLLAEIWERMGVDAADGRAFATTNELMVQYRQLICSKLVSTLVNIGLMNDRLRDRFVELELIEPTRR